MELLLHVAPLLVRPGRLILLPFACLLPHSIPFAHRIGMVSLVPIVLARYGSISPLISAFTPILLLNTKRHSIRLALLTAAKLWTAASPFQAAAIAVFEISTWNFFALLGPLDAAMLTQLVSFFGEIFMTNFLDNRLSHEAWFNASVALLGVFLTWSYSAWTEKKSLLGPVVSLVFLVFYSIIPGCLWIISIPGSLKALCTWFAIICVAIPSILHLCKGSEVSVTRKYFHFLLVGLLGPGLILKNQHALISSASFGVVAVFLILEKNKPIAVKRLFSKFLDQKSETAFVFSHVALLIGCLLPVWLQRSGQPTVENTGNFSLEALLLGVISAPSLEPGARLFHRVSESHALEISRFFSGFVLVGIADSFAAIAGVKSRGMKMPGSQRSIQGLVGFILSALASFSIVSLLNGYGCDEIPVGRVLAVALLEVYTMNLDNLLLPVYFLAL